MDLTCPNCHQPFDDSSSEQNAGITRVHRSPSLSNPDVLSLEELRAAVQHLKADNTELSRKLVQTVELRAELEDNLLIQHEDLLKTRQRESEVSTELARLILMMERGELVAASQVRELMDQIVAERNMRTGMESELEELSAAVMIEANKLVSDEKHRRVSAERRSADLQRQMEEMEEIWKLEKNQLSELKALLGRVGRERDSATAAILKRQAKVQSWPEDLGSIISASETDSNGPSSPIYSPLSTPHTTATSFSAVYAWSPECSPPVLSQSFTFSSTSSHYTEFKDFYDYQVRAERREYQPPTTPTRQDREREQAAQRFLRRVQVEDIYPTLNFDRALPAAGGASTASVFAKMTTTPLPKRLHQAIEQNMLIVTEHPMSMAQQLLMACSLCADSPSESATQFYTFQPDIATAPLTICKLCRDRLGSVCEFYNIVRMVRSGVLRSWGPNRIYREKILPTRWAMWRTRIGCEIEITASAEGSGETTSILSEIPVTVMPIDGEISPVSTTFGDDISLREEEVVPRQSIMDEERPEREENEIQEEEVVDDEKGVKSDKKVSGHARIDSWSYFPGRSLLA